MILSSTLSRKQANTPHRHSPTIGAAIIVRDAEQSIGKALQSLVNCMDQVVVVDTGSVDSTPVIASRHGAELHFMQWQNDFSVARNYALDRIRTDWVLVLDADEQLDAHSLLSCRELLNDARNGGIQLCIENSLSEDGRTSSRHHYTRLFRNRPDFRFRGAIHEQIAESIHQSGLEIVESDILIQHDGYRHVDAQKTERNSTLLRTELEKNPEDVFTKYHLGLTEFGAGNLKEAYNILHPLLHSDALSTEQREVATLRCAQAALAEDDFMLVESLLHFTSTNESLEGLRHFVLGAAHCTKRNFADALRCFTQARKTESSLVDHEFLHTSIQRLSAYLEAIKN